jgi:hypothetical protein
MHTATEESKSKNTFDLGKSSLVCDRLEVLMAPAIKVTVPGM